MKIPTWIAVLLLALPPWFVAAQSPAAGSALQPGKYVTESGWGHLTLEARKAGSQRFAIQAFGVNMASCDLEGNIRRGKSLLDTRDDGKPCVVSFNAVGSAINVSSSDQEQCQQFCGFNARFDGLYLTPAAGCDAPARRATRSKFKALYDKKAHAQALTVLQPLLDNCAKTLDRPELSNLLNDLAITHYHLGDFASCIRTLAALSEDADRTEVEFSKSYPPSDAEFYSPGVLAARTNLKLCRQGPR